MDNVELVKGVEMGEGRTSATESENNANNTEQWILFVDGAINENKSGVGIMLISPEGHKIHCALCFGFQASNNEAEYEALIVGLRLASELQVRNLKVYSNSQLIVN